MLPRGGKWLLCREIVTAPWHFAAFLHEPLFGRLFPECSRQPLRLRARAEGLRQVIPRAATRGAVAIRSARCLLYETVGVTVNNIAEVLLQTQVLGLALTVNDRDLT